MKVTPWAFPLILLLVIGCASNSGSSKREDLLKSRAYSSLLDSRQSSARLHDGPLTVNAAILLAFKNNPRLQTLETEIELARKQGRALTDLSDPEVRFSYAETESESSDPLNPTTTEVERLQGALRIFPPNPMVMRTRSHYGNALVLLAEANKKAAEHQIAIQIRNSFLNIYHLDERILLASEIGALRNQRKEALKERLAHGHATLADVLEATAEQLEAVNNKAELLSERGRIVRELGVSIGILDPNELSLAHSTYSVDFDFSSWPIEELARLALDNQAGLQALLKQIEVAHTDLRKIRLDTTVPWFSHVQGSYSEEQKDGNDEAWSIQTALSLPFFSFGSYEVEQKRAEYERLTALLDEAYSLADLEIRNAYFDVVNKERELKSYAEQIQPFVHEMTTILEDPDVQKGLLSDRRYQLEEEILLAKQMGLVKRQVLDAAVMHFENTLSVDLNMIEQSLSRGGADVP